MTQPRKLDRILRVRTLQLGLSRADEARAQAKVDSEATLRSRIAQLSEGVAPAEAEAATALSFVAAAHFRDRLHPSAAAADERLRAAKAVRSDGRRVGKEGVSTCRSGGSPDH